MFLLETTCLQQLRIRLGVSYCMWHHLEDMQSQFVFLSCDSPGQVRMAITAYTRSKKCPNVLPFWTNLYHYLQSWTNLHQSNPNPNTSLGEKSRWDYCILSTIWLTCLIWMKPDREINQTKYSLIGTVLWPTFYFANTHSFTYYFLFWWVIWVTNLVILNLTHSKHLKECPLKPFALKLKFKLTPFKLLSLN